MKKSARLLALMLGAMLTFSMAACGNGGDEGKQEAKTYTYNTYTTVSPSNWNVLTYQDNNDTQIMDYISSNLFSFNFKFDDDGEIVPGQFEVEYVMVDKLEDVTAAYAGEYGIEEGESAKAYKFTFRKDLKWDDGTAITAEDFVYSMQEQLNPLFLNYRADSYYLGSTIISGAKNYALQGQKSWYAADTPYAHYSTDLDEKIIFSIDVNKNTAASSFRGLMGFPDSYDAAKTAAFLANNYLEDVTAEEILALEGKTFAEIKEDEEMSATWAAIIGWWQTAPDEELDFFITEYEWPEYSWDNVGYFTGANKYELVMILDKALPIFNEDGTLSYRAAYNMQSLPLVKKDLYEDCKIAPKTEGALWTTNYCSNKVTTASYGPYKLANYQAGKSYTLEKNDKWFGYRMAQYKGQYETDRIVCETIADYDTAFMKFLSGELSEISIDASKAASYKNSSRAMFTPDDYVGSLQLQSSKESLQERETEGKNKTMLTYTDFRKALSLAINRADYNQKCTTASLTGLGLYNTMHYYDVANGGVYRETDQAKKVLCNVYGVDPDNFDSLDDAVDSITGYDLTQARQLVTKAYNEALEAGDISATDTVSLVYGTAASTIATRRYHQYLSDAWTELMKGTPLEGRFELTFDASYGDDWSKSFRAGAYDVCQGGWTGAAWDPGYFLLAYLGKDYMYSAAWETDKETMTFTMRGVNEEGEVTNDGADTFTATMTLMDWYNALNATADSPYQWGGGMLDEEFRIDLIAALEEEVLTHYYSVPLTNSFSASLMAYQCDYVTPEYNTFMGYGGIRYLTYNYSDAEWAKYLADNGGTIDYTK